MWRRFAAALVVLVAGFALSVLVSRGTASVGSGTSATTAAEPTTTSTATTTTTATSTTRTTTETTTTTPATTATSRATTTVTAPQTPHAKPKPNPRRSSVLVPQAASSRQCVQAGAVEILSPRRRTIVLTERSTRGRAHPRGLIYPADGSVVSIHSLQVVESCSGARRSGSVDIHALSLFGGAVTAAEVSVNVRRPSRRITLNGLRVGHRIVGTTGRRLPLGRWGLLTVRPSAPSALSVRLLHPHAGLPAGATVRVAFVIVRLPARSASLHGRRRASPVHRPLKITPALGLREYVFPVAGRASFWDSYGAFRADVAGNWHHGDDIFANVGTPVVAVANGTLNRVGWEPIGGWRLWVRDRKRNEFYYAHLSGYSPQALHSKRVRAGEVLGFVGNTGDAFTTPFHLHFEIHPHQLLQLDYDGAVDPTSYLDQWRHVTEVHVPAPMLPAKLPSGDPRREARFVFGELLAARGLARHEPSAPPRIRLPGHDVAVRPFTAAFAAPSLRHLRRGNSLLVWLLAAVASILALVAAGVVVDRRRKPARNVSEA
jgi:Peptidase family M23